MPRRLPLAADFHLGACSKIVASCRSEKPNCLAVPQQRRRAARPSRRMPRSVSSSLDDLLQVVEEPGSMLRQLVDLLDASCRS